MPPIVFKHHETALTYGDIVAFSSTQTVNGKIVPLVQNAIVLHSQMIPEPDASRAEGVRFEEQLTIEVLKDKYRKPQLTSIEMDDSRERFFGVKELTATNKRGFVRLDLVPRLHVSLKPVKVKDAPPVTSDMTGDTSDETSDAVPPVPPVTEPEQVPS